MRPLIGITGSPQGDDQIEGVACAIHTTEAVYRNGGQPLVIPVSEHFDAVEELAGQLGGLLLSGGNDINPLYFGEQPLPGLGKVNPLRDELEIRLIKAMLALDKPILGICRGCQILNVAAGGTMYQDINTQVENVLQHSQRAPRFHASHTVEILPESKLREIIQAANFRVNSFHHQANRDVATGFRVAALAPDGVTEAFESLSHRYVVGVQWHPECMIQVDEASNRLFQSFIKAC
jgi:putative glutamine amidotransferase